MPYASLKHPQGRSIRIYYETQGEGEPLLLIRGLGRSSRFWHPIRDILAQNFRLILMDNRGVGRSDAPLGTYSIPLMATDAKLLLDSLHIEAAHVFGISMGGMIAQELALRHRTKVRRLILAATSTGGTHAVRPPLDLAREFAACALKPGREAVETMTRWTVSANYIEKDPEIIDRWMRMAQLDKPRTRGILGHLTAAVRHDTWERLPYLQPHTLILTGDQDRIMPCENSDILAQRIPLAKVRRLRGVGHDITTEKPDRVALYVSDFLERA